MKKETENTKKLSGGVEIKSDAGLVNLTAAIFDSAYEDYKSTIGCLAKIGMSRNTIVEYCDEIMTLIEFIDSKKEYRNMVEKIMSLTPDKKDDLYILAETIAFVKEDKYSMRSDMSVKVFLNMWDKRVKADQEEEAKEKTLDILSAASRVKTVKRKTKKV